MSNTDNMPHMVLFKFSDGSISWEIEESLYDAKEKEQDISKRFDKFTYAGKTLESSIIFPLLNSTHSKVMKRTCCRCCEEFEELRVVTDHYQPHYCNDCL